MNFPSYLSCRAMSDGAVQPVVSAVVDVKPNPVMSRRRYHTCCKKKKFFSPGSKVDVGVVGMKESNQRPEVEEVVRSLDRKEGSLVQQLKRQSASQGS